MRRSHERKRGRARIVATAVIAVTTVLIAGATYHSIRAHQREAAEDEMRQPQPAIWSTPSDGYAPEPAHTAELADRKDKHAEVQRLKEELEKGLEQQREAERTQPPASHDPKYPLGRPPDPTIQERAEARARMRRAARARKKRERDRAYEEYLAGFPECQAFLMEGALLNDPCEPRPLSRKEWERRGKASEPVDTNADDPLTGFHGI